MEVVTTNPAIPQAIERAAEALPSYKVGPGAAISCESCNWTSAIVYSGDLPDMLGTARGHSAEHALKAAMRKPCEA